MELSLEFSEHFHAQGYAVIIAINFHGSDSYGQNFTDSITRSIWNITFEDLQLGLTAALQIVILILMEIGLQH